MMTRSNSRFLLFSILALAVPTFGQTNTPTATRTPTPTNTLAPTPTPIIGSMFGRRGDPYDNSEKYNKTYFRTDTIFSEGWSVAEPQETRAYEPYARPVLDHFGQSTSDILNFLTNVEFETNITPWTDDSNMTGTWYSTSSDIASSNPSGSYKLVADGIATATAQYDLSTVIKKGDYFTFGGRVTPGADMTLSVLIECTSPEQTFTETYSLLETDGAWQQVSVTAQLQDRQILEAVEFNTDDAVTFYVDNVGVFRAAHWPGFSPALGILDATATGDLNVTGNVDITGTLSVDGAVDLDSTLSATGNVTLNGDVAMITGKTLTVETVKAVDGDGLTLQDDGGGSYLKVLDGGLVRMGATADPTPVGGWDADTKLAVTGHSGDAEVSITSDSTSGVSYLNLGDKADEDVAGIAYFNSSNTFAFIANNTTMKTITSALETSRKAATFNTDSGDYDFQINANSITPALFLDGADGQIGVGPQFSLDGVPDSSLHIIDDDGTPLTLERDTSTPNAQDNQWDWKIQNTTNSANGSLDVEPVDAEADFVVRDVGDTESIIVDNSENALLVNPSGASTGGLTIGTTTLNSGNGLRVRRSTTATSPLMELEEADGTGVADLVLKFILSSPTASFSMGIDNSNSDVFSIGAGASLSTADAIRVYSDNKVLLDAGTIYCDSPNNKVGLGGQPTNNCRVTMYGAFDFQEISSTPTGPSEGWGQIWQTNGSAGGEDGDVIYSGQAGSTTITRTIVNKDWDQWGVSTQTITTIGGLGTAAVFSARVFRVTANAALARLTMTGAQGDFDGQPLVIEIDKDSTGTCEILDSAGTVLNGGATWVGGPTDTISFVWSTDSSAWVETARSDN